MSDPWGMSGGGWGQPGSWGGDSGGMNWGGMGEDMSGWGGMMGRRRRRGMGMQGMGGMMGRGGGMPDPRHMTPWEVEASGIMGNYAGAVGSNGSYGPSLTPYDSNNPATMSHNQPGFVPGGGNYQRQSDTTPLGLLYNMTDPQLLRYGNAPLDFRDGGPIAQQIGQYASTPISQISQADMASLMQKLQQINTGFGPAVPTGGPGGPMANYAADKVAADSNSGFVYRE